MSQPTSAHHPQKPSVGRKPSIGSKPPPVKAKPAPEPEKKKPSKPAATATKKADKAEDKGWVRAQGGAACFWREGTNLRGGGCSLHGFRALPTRPFSPAEHGRRAHH